MTNNSSYTLIGNRTVVPSADLSDATSAINVKGDTRKGAPSSGKRAGMSILSDQGDGTYKEYIALGAAATDKWQLVDGSSQVTPS